MLDSLTRYNRDDFLQRYAKSYGWLVNPDKSKRLVYIKKVEQYKVVFNDVEGMEFFSNADSNVQFEFLPITRGWHTTSLGPVILQRIPAKQYCRGINSNNTSASIATGPEERDILYIDLSIDVLKEIFEETQPSMLFEYLNGVVPWFVLSKYFLIYKSSLFFYSTKIGQVVDKGKITLNSSFVQQEVLDTIRRRGLPFTVEIE